MSRPSEKSYVEHPALPFAQAHLNAELADLVDSSLCCIPCCIADALSVALCIQLEYLQAIGSPRVISHHHAPHLICKADRYQAPQDEAIDSSGWLSSPLANRTAAIPCSKFARRAPAGAAGSVFSVHPAHSGQLSVASLADARQADSSIWSWPLPEKATRRTSAEGGRLPFCGVAIRGQATLNC